MIPLDFAVPVFRSRSTLHGYGALLLLIVLLFTTQGCKGKQKANAAERRANPKEVTITPALETAFRLAWASALVAVTVRGVPLPPSTWLVAIAASGLPASAMT